MIFSYVSIINGYIFFLPVIKEITNNIIKIKNKIFAIPAAPAAIPPNPKIAATIARITNVTVQRSIIFVFRLICYLLQGMPFIVPLNQRCKTRRRSHDAIRLNFSSLAFIGGPVFFVRFIL